MRALCSALCQYELAPLHADAASRQGVGVVPTCVNDPTALYAEAEPGVAGVPALTDAFGISRASPPDWIVVLKRLNSALPARRSCVEQAKRCLRAHPYLDAPHLRPRYAAMAPSPALRTLAARTAADEHDCDSRHQRAPSHPRGRLTTLGGHSGTLAQASAPSPGYG